jgi:hypothetical protein|tara:strand:- start:733 stop:954 length:222 start_codon:yes stop_codon:yes gene_type:complete
VIRKAPNLMGEALDYGRIEGREKGCEAMELIVVHHGYALVRYIQPPRDLRSSGDYEHLPDPWYEAVNGPEAIA